MITVATIIMEGNTLTEVSNENDLGVWISADMKCSTQCMSAFYKTTRVLGVIIITIRFKGVMLRFFIELIKSSFQLLTIILKEFEAEELSCFVEISACWLWIYRRFYRLKYWK